MKKTIIGIAGGTGSGKTTVSNLVVEELRKNGHNICLLEQDSYYKDNKNLDLSKREKLNYDHPDAIDFELLIKNIEDLKNGIDIKKPIYDFKTHLRTSDFEIVKSENIIIVEGILLFWNEKLRDLFDVKIFVDTDDDIRLLRRIERDMKERARTFESVRDQYIKTVKPMHLQFVEPSKRYADVILPRGKNNKVGIKMITSRLKYLMNKG